MLQLASVSCLKALKPELATEQSQTLKPTSAKDASQATRSKDCIRLVTLVPHQSARATIHHAVVRTMLTFGQVVTTTFTKSLLQTLLLKTHTTSSLVMSQKDAFVGTKKKASLPNLRSLNWKNSLHALHPVSISTGKPQNVDLHLLTLSVMSSTSLTLE